MEGTINAIRQKYQTRISIRIWRDKDRTGGII